ncbi:PecA family PE domain-processing aspartic protease [Mycobacterium sp. MAA66]|uniref:PecA family PE domain-processing aspartic protease n=1 Tax=Mycobacterium sp. MAA66 TaxID=3156297 RepID=UPI0035199789
MKVSAWLAASATTVGVGAALLSGAAAANAKPASDSSHSDSSHNTSSGSTAGSSAGSSSAKADKKTKSPNPQRNNNSHADTDAGQKAAAATASAATADSSAPKHAKAAKPSTAASTSVSPAAATSASGSSAQPNTPSTTPSTHTAAPAAATATFAATSGSSVTTGAGAGKVTTPARNADVSGVLSALAAIGQALTVAARDTETTLTKAAHDTSLTLTKDLTNTRYTLTKLSSASSALATSAAAGPPWQTTPSTTGDTTLQAITEVQAAQAAYAAATKSNWFAQWTNGFSGYALSVALKDLNKYQANQATLMAAYAANPTTANLNKLTANEALTNNAVGALNLAAQWTNIKALKTQASAAAVDARVYAGVPLSMYLGTEPIVKISINGGPMVKVLVDTGSSGLVIPTKYVGSQNTLGTSVGTGTSGFGTGVGSAALTYTYDQYNTSVSFGSGIKTGSVTVNLVQTGTSTTNFLNYISADGVVGVLGIGTNAVGPGGSIVTASLPGALGSGVFVNEQTKTLIFGLNPLPVVKSVSGSPNVAGYVSINGGTTKTPINLLIDTGGVYGTIPATVAGSSVTAADSSGDQYLTAGTTVSIYASDGTLLYSYKTTSTNTPTVTGTTSMNTGYSPFALGPVYINYNTLTGSTDFDY